MENSLKSVSTRLDSVNNRRESLIKDSRDVISLCSKAIIEVHALNLKGAKGFFKEARIRLQQLKRVARSDLTKYILTPEQEFVEASVILSITENCPVPSIEQLKVSPPAYILGLLDSIGEMKRYVYDRIRRNDISGAEQNFMENLFMMLSPLAVYDHIVPGVRRRLDVARILIEDVRSTITEESRRSAFMASISDLSSKLGIEPLNRGTSN